MLKLQNKKGFTLVELLAVIVILGIIMIIAIPSVLDTMEVAKTKSLEEYAQKVKTNGERTYLIQKEFEGLPSLGSADVKLYVHDIKNDLDLTNTGNYKGLFIIYKFDQSFFDKVKLSGESAKRMEPNTPYYGVVLVDDPKVLYYMGHEVDGLEDSTILSLDDIKNQFAEELTEAENPADIPENILDLYINSLTSKEGFFNFYKEELKYIDKQMREEGYTLEQVESMIPDDEAVKYMVIDGDTNTEIFTTKILEPSIVCSCAAELDKK